MSAILSPYYPALCAVTKALDNLDLNLGRLARSSPPSFGYTEAWRHEVARWQANKKLLREARDSLRARVWGKPA